MARRFPLRTLPVSILLVCIILVLSLTLARAQAGGDTGYGTCADGSLKRPGEDCRERLCKSGWAQAHGLGSDCDTPSRPGLGSDCDTPSRPSDSARRRKPTNAEVPEVENPDVDEAETHDKALADERARAAADAKRRQDERFRQDKADVLRTMKGVSSGGSGLKGTAYGPATNADATTLPLKGFDNVPNSPKLSDADRIYWHTVIPPAACFVAQELKANAACIIVDGYELREALKEADRIHAIERLILKKLVIKAASQIIVISLNGGDTLKNDVELVEAVYEAEQKVFDHVMQVIAKDMTQDPAKAARVTQWVKLDSAGLERLKRRVFAEKLANIRISQDYLQKNPNSPGIRINCGTACQQLLKAAKGVGALERWIPSRN